MINYSSMKLELLALSGKEGSTDETDIDTSEKRPRQPDLGATQTLPSITPEELKRAQEQDPTIGTVIQFWNKGVRPRNEDRMGKNMTFIVLCRQWDRFTDWVQIHRERLRSAQEVAQKNLRQAAMGRKLQHDKHLKGDHLQMGDVVLLRDHPLGRKKIQDAWKADKYRVRMLPDQDGAPVIIEPVGGGELRRVSRQEVKKLTPLHSRLHHRYSRVVNPATPLLSRFHHHCRRDGTLAFITAAAGWSTQRCAWTLALIIDIAAVS
ncbi:hypothetical protein ACOMHN_004460 [Nucella lapillus]